jgi:hypothetical protein
MRNADKIQLAEQILALVQSDKEEFDFKLNDPLVMVGTLNKRQGIRGFNVAEVGHPVYLYKDRYVILLTSEDGKSILPVGYYLETLKQSIDFL